MSCKTIHLHSVMRRANEGRIYMEILHAKSISKVYKGKIPYKALVDIDLSIQEGEFVGIMGPSGSGKTTLLNMVSTIDSPSSGEILINGTNPFQLSSEDLALFRRKQLGFVFQSFNLLSTLTVKENIVLPMTLDGVSVREMNKRVEEIAEKLNITDILSKRTFEISGGQAQRTAIARAIVHKPQLLLADEPTGNLDSKSSNDVMEMLDTLNKEEKATMMLVTHDPYAASFCSRVVFIKDGQLYNEIYCGESRQAFYQKIMDVLSLLGGKGMTFRQFAFNNIFRNKRTYAAHFLSSAFSIMIFFTYALLLFHPDLQGELKSTSATISAFGTLGFSVSQGLIFVFSFFFILYSVSSFLKTRKKEFGVLMMQGMSMRQLKKLLLIENMLIGLGSICIGIFIGLIFSKLVLLISASVLMINNGLPFYIPVRAVLLTVITFLFLFLIVSLFTFKMIKVTELVELIRAEEKPKPEPKSSVLLSLLSLISIGYGYFSVFRFIPSTNFITLGIGVLLVIIGTYFLYTQCSVYILHLAKRRETFFLKRTNILTFSELIYRMKDNATMFFIVSIISAVAFTAIGTTAALGNKDLVRMTNPYTLLYMAPENNKIADKHLSIIKNHLADANIPYRMASSSYIYTESNVYVMKLSEYNELARALGYQQETIEKEDEMLLIPGMVSQKQEFKNGDYKKNIEVIQGDWTKTFHVKKTVDNLVLPHDTKGIYIAIQDHVYDGIPLNSGPDNEDIIQYRTYGFVVDDWIKTKEVSNQLNNIFDQEPRDIHFEFRALTIELLSAKQTNGLLLMASVLVGIVFFTFAASFIYFRLYTDLNRDQQQYKMISKMGLSKRELKKVVTRQLLLMFFLPIVVAVIHTVVAYMALQQLVDFSILNSSIVILISFICIQVLYFFITRWRYLQKLHKTMEQ